MIEAVGDSGESVLARFAAPHRPVKALIQWYFLRDQIIKGDDFYFRMCC